MSATEKTEMFMEFNLRARRGNTEMIQSKLVILQMKEIKQHIHKKKNLSRAKCMKQFSSFFIQYSLQKVDTLHLT